MSVDCVVRSHSLNGYYLNVVNLIDAIYQSGYTLFVHILYTPTSTSNLIYDDALNRKVTYALDGMDAFNRHCTWLYSMRLNK